MASDTVIFTIKINAKDATSELKAFQSDMKKLGASAKDVWDGLAGFVKDSGKALIGFVSESVTAFADYEESLGAARRTMGLTKEETDALGLSLQGLALDMSDLGLQGAVSSEKLAGIAGIAGQMGLSFNESEADLLSFTSVIAKTAVAFEMSAEKTASSLAILSNIFDLPISKANELAGAIAVLADASQATASSLIDFMQRVGPGFAELGGSAEQLLGIGATLKEAGISTEVMGTAMSQLLSNMSVNYAKFEEILARGGLAKGMLEMKINSGDALGAITLVVDAMTQLQNTASRTEANQAMRDLGFQGSRALVTFQSLVAQFPKLQGFLEQIKDPLKNAQTLQDKYNAAIDTLTQRWNATKNALTIIKQVVGKELANAFESLLEKRINPLMERLATWVQTSPAFQTMLRNIGDIIGVIGDKLADLGEKAMTWLESSKGNKTMAKTFDDTKVAVMNLAHNIEKQLIKAWKELKTEWGEGKKTFEWIKTEFPAMWAAVKMAADQAFKTLKQISIEIFNIRRTVEDTKGVWKEFWNLMGEKNIIDFAKDAAGSASKLTNSMLGLNKGLKDVKTNAAAAEKQLTGNSLFPDWVMWAKRTEEEMVDVVAEVEELASTVNLSVSEFDNLMGQTGLGLDEMKNKLSAFSEEQLGMLSTLGSGMLRMTTDQLKSTLMVMETVKTMSDGLATQSASNLQQISARVRELTLSDPFFGALAGSKSLTNATAAQRAGQTSTQDQFAAQKLVPIMPAKSSGQPINNLIATVK